VTAWRAATAAIDRSILIEVAREIRLDRVQSRRAYAAALGLRSLRAMRSRMCVEIAR
jgi:hypothetical protein